MGKIFGIIGKGGVWRKRQNGMYMAYIKIDVYIVQVIKLGILNGSSYVAHMNQTESHNKYLLKLNLRSFWNISYLIIFSYSLSFPLESLQRRYITEASTLAGLNVFGSFNKEMTDSKIVLKQNHWYKKTFWRAIDLHV